MSSPKIPLPTSPCPTCGANGLPQDIVFNVPLVTTTSNTNNKIWSYWWASWLDKILHGNLSSSSNGIIVAQGYHDQTHLKTMAHAVDFDARVGTRVLAARDGQVVELASHFKKGGPREALRAKANYVVLRHEIGTYSRYYHLKYVHVKIGQHVRAGELIGKTGMTGYTFGPHLHFDVVDVCGTEIFSLSVKATPSSTSTVLPCVPATFSTGPPKVDVTMTLQAANPLDLSNNVFSDTTSPPPPFKDTCLVCKRGGTTSFREKAEFAKAAGASCLIIVDNDPSMRQVIPILIGDSSAQSVGIMVLFVSYADGKVLLEKLMADPCTITISKSPYYDGDLVGALRQAQSGGNAPHDEVVAFCKPITMPIRFAPTTY